MQKVKRPRLTRGMCRVFGVLWLALLMMGVAGAANNSVDWSVGDVFVASGNGGYQVWHSADPTNPGQNAYGKLQTISDGSADATTGCAFDSAYRFFGTNFTSSIVDQYSIDFPTYVTNGFSPGLAGQFTTGLPIVGVTPTSTHNESIVFDGSGNFFVGHADGGKSLELWTRTGGSPSYELATSWTLTVENRGVDWIDLASDGTIYYTSEGRKIFTFNPGTNAAGVFADLGQPGLPNYTLFAVRILPNGNVLVADKKNIKQVAAGGSVVKTYDASGQDDWEALSLDPNGTSFWAGDATTHKFYRFNISSGAVEAGPYNTNASLGGICVHGGFSQAQTAIAAPPTSVVLQIVAGGNPLNSGNNTNTISFRALSGATFTASLVGLTSQPTVTVRESLVPLNVGQSDPAVFSFNPGNPDQGTQVGTNMACDTTLTSAHSLGNVCEVFEFEANPNLGFTSTNIQIIPNVVEDTPNLRLIRNLDEDVTDGVVNYPLSGTKSKCVFTVNSQVFDNNLILCGGGFTSPIKGTNFTKNSTSTITFKFQVAASGGSCGSGPFPNDLRPLLMITQLDPAGLAAPNSIPVIVAGKSGGPPVFTFTGNTWQMQVKTTDMPAGFTYLATVIDLGNPGLGIPSRLGSFSTNFTLN
jgi:hypothetical protein